MPELLAPMNLGAELDAALASIGGFEPRPLLAIGVSGGPDSMALVILADRWARRRGGRVWGLTVDHRLRPESAANHDGGTMTADTHAVHAEHAHQHGPNCGHASVRHDGHIDYVHDGHAHASHEGHYDEHSLPHIAHAEHGHAHEPGCGHDAVRHGDHIDYVHDGHHHAAHGDHYDEH